MELSNDHLQVLKAVDEGMEIKGFKNARKLLEDLQAEGLIIRSGEFAAFTDGTIIVNAAVTKKGREVLDSL